MPEKQTNKQKKKSAALKTFLASYVVFAIFASAEHMESPCEAKNKSLIMFTLQTFKLFIMLYLCFKLYNKINKINF